MGNSASSAKMGTSEPLSSTWEDVREDAGNESLNGLILNEIIINEDILENLLSYTRPEDILNLTQVSVFTHLRICFNDTFSQNTNVV